MKRILMMMAGLLVYPAVAHAQQGAYHDMHDWMMGYGFGGWFMWLIFLILIGVVIYFVMQGARNRDGYHGGSGGSPGDTPMDILKKRYARGELTKEEYERMKKDLGP